jgi:hypothetical protein
MVMYQASGLGVIGPEGMCCTHDQPGWQEKMLRLVDGVVDALSRETGTTRS